MGGLELPCLRPPSRLPLHPQSRASSPSAWLPVTGPSLEAWDHTESEQTTQGKDALLRDVAAPSWAFKAGRQFSPPRLASGPGVCPSGLGGWKSAEAQGRPRLSQSPWPLVLPRFPVSGTISQHSVRLHVRQVPRTQPPVSPSPALCAPSEWGGEARPEVSSGCLPQAPASPSLPTSHRLL